MDSFKKIKELSHHAYAFIGGDSLHDELVTFLKEAHSISAQANPDFFQKKYEVFTIDDARELKSIHETRPIHASGKKIFVVVANGITVEAQNALLKLLEEPAEYAHFFLILPSAHLILPTVKSRLSFVTTGTHDGNRSSGNASASAAASAFIKTSASARIEIIKKLLEDIAKEKKTKQDAITFLDDIQNLIYIERGVVNGKATLEAIEIARTYMNDRAPSMKMLLEYVALNI